MNIHPIVVHFPIAILTVYAVLEFLSISHRFRAIAWLQSTKAFLVIVGAVTALLTLSTGEAAEHALTDQTLRPLVEMHATFAAIASDIFVVLALVYVFVCAQRQAWYIKTPSFIQTLIRWYLKVFNHVWVLAVLAMLGFIAMTITGSLGGAIVYGPEIDPVVSFFYNFFF